MNRQHIFFGILALMVTLTARTAVAQNYPVSIIINPAPGLHSYPTDAMVYAEDPMSVFKIQLVNNSSETLNIYLDLDLSCVMSSAVTQYHVYTDNSAISEFNCINLPPHTLKTLTRQEFTDNMARRLRSELSLKQIESILQLPEGEYHFCLTAQNCDVQSSQGSFDDRQVSVTECFTFDICYSGSAPDIVSPVLIDDGDIAPKLIPLRKTSFSWLGVVSNCVSSYDFMYNLKFVEVYPNQTPQYAVENNPVIASINRGRSTYYVYDYLNDPYVSLDSGQRYAVQVEAYLENESAMINLVNDGKSEVMSFIWMGPSSTGNGGNGGGGSSKKKGKMGREDVFKGGRDVRSYREKGNRMEVQNGITPGIIVFPEADSDVSDSTVPFRVRWTPASGPSLASADFKVSLYEAVDTVDASTGESRTVPVGKPLKSVVIHQPATPPAVMEASGFEVVLANNKYYMAEVVTMAAYTFDARFKITEIKYINGYPETHRFDSIATGPDTVLLKSSVPFRWVGHTNSMPGDSPRLLQFKQTDTLTISCQYDPAGPLVLLEWVCGYNIGTDYTGVIYRSVDGANPEPIATITPSDRQYRDTKLPTGRYAVYYVQLMFGKGAAMFKSKPTSCTIN